LSAHANLDIIRYQSRDGKYTVLKGSGFVNWWGVSRFEGQPHRLAKPLPFVWLAKNLLLTFMEAVLCISYGTENQ
jgi:hypothetical protein